MSSTSAQRTLPLADSCSRFTNPKALDHQSSTFPPVGTNNPPQVRGGWAGPRTGRYPELLPMETSGECLQLKPPPPALNTTEAPCLQIRFNESTGWIQPMDHRSLTPAFDYSQLFYYLDSTLFYTSSYNLPIPTLCEHLHKLHKQLRLMSPEYFFLSPILS